MSFSFFVDFAVWIGFLSFWINWIVANPTSNLTEDLTCDWQSSNVPSSMEANESDNFSWITQILNLLKEGNISWEEVSR